MVSDARTGHWTRSARESLESARLLHRVGSHAPAILLCFFAVEKALKAAYVRHYLREPQPTDDLWLLASQVPADWTPDDRALLQALSDDASAARADYPEWSTAQGTAINSIRWLQQGTRFLSILLR